MPPQQLEGVADGFNELFDLGPHGLLLLAGGQRVSRTLNIVKRLQSVDAARRISRALNPAVALIAGLLAEANPYLSLGIEIAAGVIVYMGLVLTLRPRLAREIALFLPLHALGRMGRRYATAPRA